jgi:hypothetical protein
LIETRPTGSSRLVILGVVRGLVSEADALAAALDRANPARIALALAPDEMKSYASYFVGSSTEPFVPLTESEGVEVRELQRYGEVRMPHPSVLRTLNWAREKGRPVSAVDPTEDEYAEMFADNIGYWELVRRTLRERRLLRSPPRAATADEFLLAWDQRVNKGRGSRRLQTAREAHVAEEVRLLEAEGGTTAVIVDRERVPRVLAALVPIVPNRGAT